MAGLAICCECLSRDVQLGNVGHDGFGGVAQGGVTDIVEQAGQFKSMFDAQAIVIVEGVPKECIETFFTYIHDTDGVDKTGVGGTGKNKVGKPQLLDVLQSLKKVISDDGNDFVRNAYGAMDRVSYFQMVILYFFKFVDVVLQPTNDLAALFHGTVIDIETGNGLGAGIIEKLLPELVIFSDVTFVDFEIELLNTFQYHYAVGAGEKEVKRKLGMGRSIHDLSVSESESMPRI